MFIFHLTISLTHTHTHKHTHILNYDRFFSHKQAQQPDYRNDRTVEALISFLQNKMSIENHMATLPKHVQEVSFSYTDRILLDIYIYIYIYNIIV